MHRILNYKELTHRFQKLKKKTIVLAYTKLEALAMDRHFSMARCFLNFGSIIIIIKVHKNINNNVLTYSIIF